MVKHYNFTRLVINMLLCIISTCIFPHIHTKSVSTESEFPCFFGHEFLSLRCYNCLFMLYSVEICFFIKKSSYFCYFSFVSSVQMICLMRSSLHNLCRILNLRRKSLVKLVHLGNSWGKLFWHVRSSWSHHSLSTLPGKFTSKSLKWNGR